MESKVRSPGRVRENLNLRSDNPSQIAVFQEDSVNRAFRNLSVASNTPKGFDATRFCKLSLLRCALRGRFSVLSCHLCARAFSKRVRGTS